MIGQSKLIKFVAFALGVVKDAIPKYSNRFSKRIYTQQQLCVLLMLKKKLKVSYRDLIELLSLMPEILKILHFLELPHFTTVQKFFSRISEKELLLMIKTFTSNIVAVDGTGIHSYSSKHYDFVIHKKNSFQKLAIAIDTKTKKILNAYTCDGFVHDTNTFLPLVKPLSAKYVVADKGFDSNKNREYAKLLGIKPVIPYREHNSLLKKLNELLNKKIYNKRPNVEGVFSVMKRKFGDCAYSKRYENIRKEMFLKCVSYNVYVDARLRVF